MARLDDLVAQVKDPALQAQLQSAVGELKSRRRFGLVFEEHIPETSALFGLPIVVGATVQLRRENGALYRVQAVQQGTTTLEAIDGGETRQAPVADLLVVKRLGEPLYPALKSVGAVRRAASSRPAHAVINGENYHALQLLGYFCSGQVDCIYIDPPYNSGSRDWRYNNRFVDNNDSWRHSKWLSFMDKRLRLAKLLLRPEDGVLIVTVDENEVHHLGMLLERLFPEPDYFRYMITIVYNPKGTGKANFGRVDEQAMFVVPNVGHDLINPRPANSADEEAPEISELEDLARELFALGRLDANELLDDDGPLDPVLRPLLQRLVELESESARQLEIRIAPASGSVGKAETAQTVDGYGHGPDDDGPAEDLPSTDNGIVQELTDLSATRPEGYEDLFLRRRGQESSHRANRPNQFYAILVDEAKRQVVGVGPSLTRDEPYGVIKAGDVLTVYPINRDGEERVWRYRRETMQRYIDEGAIVVGRPHPGDPQPYTLNHRKLRGDFRRLKTVWWEKAHDAGTSGTSLLDRFLGQRRAFPFPKSLYAVRDCLAAVVANRPNALIVDFFAGSGTTFHATCLLNAEDGGRRRSILVTNNEVGEPIAAQLRKAGTWPGDPEYEAHGIFHVATRPRCTAAITGTRPDGKPIRGSYRDGRPYADGFEESVEFFDLTYLAADSVDLDGALDELQPAIWLGARAIGERAVDLDQPWILPESSEYGVLLKETRFRAFRAALDRRPEVSIVYLRTDSPESFAEMADSLPSHVRAQMLPRDYRLFFRSAGGSTQ